MPKLHNILTLHNELFNDEEERFASYASAYIRDKMAHQRSSQNVCPYKDSNGGQSLAG